jgi:HTH-type transcriptional regulator/antitoxin HigA
MPTTTQRPFRPIRPGEILQEELEARGWTQVDLSEILGRPIQAVNEIIAGKKTITPETAVALSRALGTTAEYWLRLDAQYRLDLLRQRTQIPEEDIARRAKVFTVAPVKELLKRGWIVVADPKDPEQLERAVCGLLRTKSISEPPALPFAARSGRSEDPQSASLTVWVAYAKKLAAAQKIAKPFATTRLKESVSKLPQLSTLPDGVSQVPRRLAALGIRFVVAEHLPNTRVDGAAFWLSARAPVVVVSLRYDRADWFWFTLMHELAHIVSGHARSKALLDIGLVGRDSEPASQNQTEETVANRLASEWLIPVQPLTEFLGSTKPHFSRDRVVGFAETLNIHPGIVVGRLQHDGHLPWTHLRNLLERVRPQLEREVVRQT